MSKALELSSFTRSIVSSVTYAWCKSGKLNKEDDVYESKRYHITYLFSDLNGIVHFNVTDKTTSKEYRVIGYNEYGWDVIEK